MHVSKNKTGSVRINVTLRTFRVTIVALEKKYMCTYSECVSVTLFIQHAKRMRHGIESPMVSLILLCFSTLSH